MGKNRSVKVPLTELRAEIVALEVCEDVAHEERV
jgi:hypothetical protein